ncbi:MAG: F0F1 ATP synthase subunit gamma [Alphaproteobacteria bacterium]|nr:F0F1 ATP synthase subunit gamma [Alphaproteobacteria bacterium]
MSRTGELARRIASLGALDDAVSAMSSLSAHHLRRARAAAPAARAYRDELGTALARAGVAFPVPGPGPAMLVVVGSQLGLCGGYNSRVAEAAVARRAALGAGPTLAVGRRLSAALSRRHLDPDTRLEGVTSLDGVPALVLELATRALVAHHEQGLASVEILAARFRGVGDDAPDSTTVLPLSLPPSDGAHWAVRYVDRPRMQHDAARELLYVTLLARVTDAVAAEHAARLVATRQAGTWLDDQVTRLRRQLARLRQEQGTQETLEVASAARVRRR